MPTSLNRALQVRAADRLRDALPRDETTGLPQLGGILEAQQRELCEVGGGRLAAVAITADLDSMVEVARLLEPHVRRTDLLGVLDSEALLVLAPGLNPVGGQCLVDRLRDVLLFQQVEASVGIAYRCAASGTAWTTRALAAEAQQHAAEPLSA